MATILITDDEANIRNHLATYVRSLGHDVETASDGVEALAAADRRRFDVVFSDVRMARMDGMALLHELRRRAPETTVVLMTAYATVAQAVEAIRAGAPDYLVKPFGLEQVDLVLARVLEVQRLRRENRRLKHAAGEAPIVTSASPAMQHALATAERAAASDAVVLLTGESGTGKTVLARQIHAWSRRAAKPFVTIACTTLAEHLLESELFGHARGAFTGALKDKAGRVEAAEGGTLFFDEIGELSMELQAKLLRFLEERRFRRIELERRAVRRRDRSRRYVGWRSSTRRSAKRERWHRKRWLSRQWRYNGWRKQLRKEWRRRRLQLEGRQRGVKWRRQRRDGRHEQRGDEWRNE